MRLALAVAAIALLAGCQAMRSGGGAQAVADLQPTRGNSTSGTISFTQQGGRVLVSGDVRGLRPNQEHGFHIHEVGDCSSGDGMSTKGHFNPFGKPHSDPGNTERHAGDMPALRADASGNARVNFSIDIITVEPGSASVVGRGLIVHAAPDDYKTQPTGNAGARMACAIISRR